MKITITLVMFGMLTLSAWAFDSFDQAYEAAEKDKDARQFTAAVEKLHMAVQLAGTDEDKGRAFYQAGLCWHWAGEPEKAIVEFGKLLAMETPPPNLKVLALRLVGESYFNMENYEKAAEFYTRFLAEPKAPPKFKESVQNKMAEIDFYKKFSAGQAAKVDRRYHDGVALFHEAAELTKDESLKAEAFYHAGLYGHWGGKPEKAIEEFNKGLALEEAPKHFRALSLRLIGMNYEKLKNDEKAEAAYKAFLAMPEAPANFKEGVKKSLQEISDRKGK